MHRAFALFAAAIFAAAFAVHGAAQAEPGTDAAAESVCSLALATLAASPDGPRLTSARATCPAEAVNVVVAAIANARMQEGAEIARDRLENGIAGNLAEIERVRERSMQQASEALQSYANTLSGTDHDYASALAQSMNPNASEGQRLLAVVGAAGMRSSDSGSQALGAVAANLSGANVAMPSASSAGGGSGDCADGPRRAKLLLMTRAGQDMSQASAMSNWNIYERQLDADQNALSHEDCARPISSGGGQRGAFLEDARKNMCGVQAVSCILRQVNAQTSPSECQAIADRCQQQNPVPQ